MLHHDIDNEFLEERGIGIKLSPELSKESTHELIHRMCEKLEKAITSHYDRKDLVKPHHYVSVFFISDMKPLSIRRPLK